MTFLSVIFVQMYNYYCIAEYVCSNFFESILCEHLNGNGKMLYKEDKELLVDSLVAVLASTRIKCRIRLINHEPNAFGKPLKQL